MVFVAGLSLGFFFMFMGHSLLVHFLVEDNLNMAVPLKQAFFPWPSKGKAVACICLSVAAFFAWVAVKGVSAFKGMGSSEWAFVGIFVGFPLSWYVSYFFRRIYRSGGAYLFKATRNTPGEARIPVILATLMTLFGYLVKYGFITK